MFHLGKLFAFELNGTERQRDLSSETGQLKYRSGKAPANLRHLVLQKRGKASESTFLQGSNGLTPGPSNHIRCYIRGKKLTRAVHAIVPEPMFLRQPTRALLQKPWAVGRGGRKQPAYRLWAAGSDRAGRGSQRAACSRGASDPAEGFAFLFIGYRSEKEEFNLRDWTPRM